MQEIHSNKQNKWVVVASDYTLNIKYKQMCLRLHFPSGAT